MKFPLPWSPGISHDAPVEVDLSQLMAVYRTESTSTDTMEYEGIKLVRREQTEEERSRKILCATGIRNPHDPKHCLKIRLAYQKRHKKRAVGEGEEWSDLRRVKLSDLEAGEEIQIDLSSAQTAQLAEHLQNLYELSSEGIEYGTTEKVIVSAADSPFLEQLGQALKGSSPERAALMKMLSGLDPDGFEVAALEARHKRRRAAIRTFQEQLKSQTWREAGWEAFFHENQWIFGHGLAYRFLTSIQEQAHLGGESVGGQGGQVTDHLMATAAVRRFTVLVEVKTPQANLIETKPYRNGVHRLGGDVAGGVSQLQVNCRKWAQASEREENRNLEESGILTILPKGILVVGNTTSLETHDMRVSFELFRREIHNPEIVTFDELYERAKFLVEHELEPITKE